MKKFLYIILIIISALILTTCRKRPELKIYNLEMSEEAVVTTTSGATITANYSYPGAIPSVTLFLSTNSSMVGAVDHVATVSETTITATIDNLVPNTKYYYYFRYSNGINLINTETKNFTTEGYTLPEVSTGEISEVASNSAHCSGEVTSAGNGVVSAIGFCYGTRQNPNLQDNVINCGDTLGVFETDLTNLDINTQYYVRAFATNEAGTAYGEQKTFTTLGQVPTLVTIPVTSITSSSAVSGGTVTSSGGNAVIDKGVCWSTNEHPTISDSHTSDGSGNGAYISNLTELLPNTLYYVRAYATNSEGTGYGNELTFTTSASLAVLTTKSVTEITQTSANCGGNITNSGGMDITARGVCWSTSHNPTTNDNHTEDGAGIGEFDSELADLSANVKYYVRAYAISDYGTSYGNEVEFTTSMGMPTVSTKSVTGITASSASCGGEVTNSGGGTISARGVCWSTSQSPTISDNHTTDGTGVGDFSSSITGLNNNVTYYVRAYATNSHGTAYGEERSFTTQEGLAVVTTTDITNITATSSSSGGEITDDGGFSITARGVCWSTNQNPTTEDAHTSDGTGTGFYTSSLTSLSYNTTYYVRAYATNSKGISYGEEKTFTTNKLTPTVTTTEVTSVTSNSAISGGNITSDGGAAVTARGICWSTSQNPTISGNHTTDGNGTGEFTSTITGLEESTTYYVRAYATNSEGTSYGSQKTFTTSQNVVVPTVTTSEVTNISTTSASCGGNVTSAGNGTVSAKGVCWSTSQNPTVSDSHTTDGTGTGSFTSNISGLYTNTTYYVRAYATNEVGTAYGEQKSFTTEQILYPVGALNGLFTINANGDQVWFSQGNLQYQASTNTWRFAENQYDYVGSSNSNISSTYSGWIDLFGWGTSGYHDSHDPYNVNYQPWSKKMEQVNTNYNYWGYGPSTNMASPNLTESSANYDWGVYNQISNGGNTTNQWRTLTNAEWQYVFNSRTTISGIRYAKANVNNVNGVILLPDNWNSNSFSLSNINSNDANFSSNILTASQWNTLEHYGAVFLSAAGLRYNETYIVEVGSKGNYWAASCEDNSRWAATTFFDVNYMNTYGYCQRSDGASVRLVQDYNDK